MSSTLRGGERHQSDYYVTPEYVIESLLDTMPDMFDDPAERFVLDPCAGGGIINGKHFDMPYPSVLRRRGYTNITTLDIREDSLAIIKGDFLTKKFPFRDWDLIITNPPFNMAEEITRKALDIIDPESGKVVMLQRLNWLGGIKRYEGFWKHNPPTDVYIHVKRIAFGGTKATDSIEYAHFVWDRTNNSGVTGLHWVAPPKQ